MCNDYRNILISLITSFIGVVLALFLDRRKMPKIELKLVDSINIENDYSNLYPTIGKCKFYRILVVNKKMPKFLEWLIMRNTAENCRAHITITGIDNSTNFSFDGRWTDTPELPFLSREDYLQKIINPDPVTIISGGSQKLDLFAKFENETCAYIWNNKSYSNNWKTPEYKLLEGNYCARITINTQNGISATKIFKIIIDKTISGTCINNC